MKKWNDDGLYINDIDYTVDIRGCMDKELLIQHLISNYSYNMEKQDTTPDTLDNGGKIILDNTHLVGSHCLTFFSKDNDIKKRKKFYNKFIQSLESRSVRSKIGSHISEWVNNPEERLRTTIGQCLNSGLLRLEITYYTHSLPSFKEIDEDINELKTILKHAPKDIYFFTPIREQYRQYANIVKENLLVIEPNYKIVLYCRSINSITEK